jgi:hypothetical protein
MSKFAMLRDALRPIVLALTITLFTMPALAGEIYSWRTEDGGYAFTDDPKAIPARYVKQSATRKAANLSDYPRLTAPAAGSTEAYSEQLDARLEHLRRLNRDLDAAYARTPEGAAVEALSVQTGQFNVGVPVDQGSEGPVVIEKVRFRHKGEMATRHNVVIRKGDEVIAVIKGSPLVTQIDQAPEISGTFE